MKSLFSKTVQVNELAQISVIEDRGKGIIIQGLNLLLRSYEGGGTKYAVNHRGS